MIWALAHWRLVVGGAFLAVVLITLGWSRHEVTTTRAQLTAVRGTIVRMDEAGRAQARAAAEKEAEAAEITRRATDALVVQIVDARARGDAVARRLQQLAALSAGGPVPGAPEAAGGPPEAGGGPTGPPEAAAAVAEYARACEADSARLTAWQDWFRAQVALYGPGPR